MQRRRRKNLRAISPWRLQLPGLWLLLLAYPPGQGHAFQAKPDQPTAESQATPVTSITTQPGFRIELVRSARAQEGSWISMTFDDQGRLILGRDATGVARLTLSGAPGNMRYELIDNTLRHCRGVLYAHESLYVCATNSKGFYRLQDTNGDDRFDQVQLLKAMDYRSRYGHGTNQVVLGPDQDIYLVNGNDVSFPPGSRKDSPYRDPRNDHLVPNPHDAGHDNRVGHIIRMDPDGKNWQIIAGGFRNQFDMAFNRDGEMFTYDADMEWDAGLPWYRPTRINHVVSAGEYGWRWRTGKWPVYFHDSLPTTLDLGRGSPTGMEFGSKSNFPPRYQRALFLADWQNGRILLVDMEATGASYTGHHELFLEGSPLNVCDMTFGPDGALYFITGGRGSQSGLYRVTYQGQPVPSKPITLEQRRRQSHAQAQRAIRHQLEVYHVQQSPEAIPLAWKHLNHTDRWIRFAARVALENQPLDTWKDRALEEKDPWKAITALMATSRRGHPEDLDSVLKALSRFSWEQFEPPLVLATLRTYQLAMIRLGKPNPMAGRTLVQRLERTYPHERADINHLLCELLVYLDSPTVVAKTIPLLSHESSQEEQIRYARILNHANQGWTRSSRQSFLQWLNHARFFRGGKLVKTTVTNLQKDLLKQLEEADRQALATEIEALEAKDDVAVGTSLPIIRDWKMSDFMTPAKTPPHRPSFSGGKQALITASCLKCHAIDAVGGQVGPDLTQVGKRFNRDKLLESILEPSRVIDPKYADTAYVMTNGKIIVGRPVGVSKTQITVETNPLTETRAQVNRARIAEASRATTSPMPSGLVNVLTRKQILDLLAYLQAGGNSEHPIYSNQD